MRFKFILVLIVLTVLCVPAFGQTTANEWYYKGETFLHQGKYNEAIQAYDKAIELAPQNATFLNQKGYGLNQLGRFYEAIKCYNKSIELAPQNVTFLNNMGVALNELCMYDEAIAYFKKAIEINPQYVIVRNNLAVALKNKEIDCQQRSMRCYGSPDRKTHTCVDTNAGPCQWTSMNVLGRKAWVLQCNPPSQFQFSYGEPGKS